MHRQRVFCHCERALKAVATTAARNLPILGHQGETGADLWADHRLLSVVVTGHLPLNTLQPSRLLSLEPKCVSSVFRRQGQIVSGNEDIQGPRK